MRTAFLFATVAATLSAPSLRAQTFQYEKYTLPNGMTVILHVDHRLPTVAINTWFRVGSKDEPKGRSGFAHLFEHLMFMGTERVPGNQFDVLMEQGGGSNNASTTEDRTNYFSSGPSSLLPTLLWLDADRLEDLGRTMTQEKLDRQRDIVRNEIRQNVENSPYGRAGELVYRLMYPEGHPYHEAVYGTHEDLEAATVDNVKSFFATYYVPNNASLVVAGDFDPAVIKPLVAELFGTLQRGGEVTRRTVPEVTLPGVVRTTMLDKVQLPQVNMVWHSPRAYSEGDAELTLCAAVLSSGKTSRLYKRLVFDERIATDVAAWQDSLALGSMFHVAVTATADGDLDRIERAVDEELARIREQGVDRDELARRVAGLELGRLSRLQNLGAVADQLNHYEFAWGEPDSFARDLERYRSATPERVQRVAQATLDPSRRVIVRVLPEKPEHKTSARDHAPAPAPASAFALPAATTFALQNGIPVQLWTRRELPLVSMQVLFRTGAVLTDPRHAGLAELCAEMLQEGAGELDALQFSDAVQALGARLDVSCSHESAAGSLTVLRRNLDRGVALLADALQRPRLSQTDWDRKKALHLADLAQQDDEPGVVANRVAMRLLFGREQGYGWPVDGTIASVTPLALDDIRREHTALFAPQHAAILIAGDLGQDECKEMLERAFGGWSAGAPSAAPAATPPAALVFAPGEGLRVALVDRPAAVQTVVRFYSPSYGYADAGRLPRELLGTILGGSFTSRLNQNLREDHGYTYGARAGFTVGPRGGWFGAGTNVRSDVTGASIAELMKELRRIGGGDAGDVDAAEVVKASETIRTETVQSFGSLAGLIGNASEQLLNGRDLPSLAKDLAAMPQITAAQLNAMGKDAVRLERGLLVLVGDRATVLAQLQGSGLPTPFDVDTDGAPAAR